LEAEYLARIAAAAELQVQLATATASRVRTPLGVSPLLDAQRRIAVVLDAADGPMTASDLVAGHLTKAQQKVFRAALNDGLRRGVFAAVGGVLGRGARYSLADPEPIGLSWDEVRTAADTVRARRGSRQAG
jgi:hypothetical protein